MAFHFCTAHARDIDPNVAQGFHRLRILAKLFGMSAFSHCNSSAQAMVSIGSAKGLAQAEKIMQR
jgi:hypothetical protein